MKKVYKILLVLHLFVGLGAMAGGSAAILSPQSPIGMSTDVLNNSPFSDFLIPGIILFAVIGVGNIFSAIMMFFKLKYKGYISSIFSFALVIWIIVQCIMLRTIVGLHIIFFIIGLIQSIISIIILFNQHTFITNIIISIISKLSDKYPNNPIIKTIYRLIRNLVEI